MFADLEFTLSECSVFSGVTTELVTADFIEWAALRVGGSLFGANETFSHIVMNPPYKKIRSGGYEHRLLGLAGVEVPNLYAAFLALGARLLGPGGQMVAITPRSFANGPYFKSFRRDLLARTTLRRIHVFDERDMAFRDSEVLQENVVFLVQQGSDRSGVKVTSSSLASETSLERVVPYDEVVRPDDSECFIHLSPSADDAAVASLVARQPSTLETLGLSVSTGRVVDFRSKTSLREEYEEGAAPLVYPTHLSAGTVRWPKVGKKPNALAISAETLRLLLPSGSYVLVKRFSSKEERRRVVASVVTTCDLPGDCWAFENHLNVFHCDGEGMQEYLAIGLAVWLNSTPVDTAFRQFSGHTQVNATDLRNMRFPALCALKALGETAGTASLSQEKADALVQSLVFGSSDA